MQTKTYTFKKTENQAKYVSNENNNKKQHLLTYLMIRKILAQIKLTRRLLQDLLHIVHVYTWAHSPTSINWGVIN